MKSTDTIQLIEHCRAGDAFAIESLVTTYQRHVYRLALSILDDPLEADEATQDAFVAALSALDTYRGDSTFKTWLYAITLNVCRGRLRKRRARQRLQQTLQSIFHLVRHAATPEEIFIQDEVSTALRKAVHTLDDKHRLLVILRYGHELPIAEIAMLLGVSERTIHNRLRTAHERLRTVLGGKSA